MFKLLKTLEKLPINCLALLALVNGLPQFAVAQDMILSEPMYEVGDTFVYDNKRVETVRAVGADSLTWATRRGREYVRSAAFFVPLLSWETNSQKGEANIVGSTNVGKGFSNGARFTAVRDIVDKQTNKSRRNLQYWNCRALKETSLEVPAGLFDVIPIQCDRYSPGTMRTLYRQTWYYAQDVGHYVQRDSISFLTGASSSYRLIASLTGDFANRTRVESLLRWIEEGD